MLSSIYVSKYKLIKILPKDPKTFSLKKVIFRLAWELLMFYSNKIKK